MKKAVAYARFSSDNQRTESIDAQLRAIRAYAKDNDIIIVDEYIDQAKSGTNADREDFQRMLAESGTGKFEIVLVHKLDRFSRNRYDSAFSKNLLKQNGVKVVSVLEKFDDSPESIILEGLMESLNEYYSANLSREVRKGMKENALACKYTGGYVPLGYRVNSEMKYEVREDEAEIVRFIFEAIRTGSTYAEVIAELNSRGLKTRAGKNFGKNSLYSILKNEKYVGVYVYNREAAKDVRGKRNSHREKDSEDVIRIADGVPAIISREEFDAVQEILRNRKHISHTRSDASTEYLLTGKIYCGVCGGKYCGNKQYSGRKKTLYYSYRCNVRSRKSKTACGNREISRSCIESFVMKMLAKVLFSPDRIPAVISEYNKAAAEKNNSHNNEINQLKKSIQCVSAEINNLVSVVASTGSAALVNAIKDKEKEMGCLNAKLAELERESAKVDVDEALIIRAFEYGKQLMESGEIPNLRQLINLYVDRIDVFPDSISVSFNLLRGLQAKEGGEVLDKLSRTLPNELVLTETISRSAESSDS